MAATLGSKSNGAQIKLLKIVNDQRAKCKLTTLEDVMDHTGYSWVESMIEHARDLFQDHSSSAISEMDMNVNILRSPKKDRSKRAKKTTAPKKASPYKKSRLPKESTPPRASPKKISQLLSSSIPSPRSSTSTKVADRDSVSSSIKAANTRLPEKKASKETIVEIDLRTPEGKPKQIERSEPADVVEKDLNEEVRIAQTAPHNSERKRKSQDDVEEEVKSTKRQSPRRSSPTMKHSQIAATIEQGGEDDEVNNTVSSKGDAKSLEIVMQPEESVHRAVEMGPPMKSENYSIIAETTEEITDEMEAEEEDEVSRVMIEEKDVQVPPPEAIAEASKSNADSSNKMIAPLVASRVSVSESEASNGTRSTRNDDVSSDLEPEVAPPTTAPKSSLRERIDKFRSIFSPAARPASSIPRLSPPKLQSPPRSLFSRSDSISSKASSKSTSPSTKTASPTLKTGSFSRPPSPSKSPFMSPPKAPAVKATVKAPAFVSISSQPIKMLATNAKITSKPTQTIKVSGPVHAANLPIPPIRFASMSASNTVSNALAPAPIISTTSTSTAKPTVAPVVAPVSAPVKATPAIAAATVVAQASKVVKPAPQVKPIAAAAAAAAAPHPVKVAPTQPASVISMANPFQKAQQQQQQAALATTSTLRVKQGPPPSTAHIELEEPDSAYSDSEDEETVRRRQQHKPWETREGLAKALEEQAHIDADMIFGIPHGAVPIDEILPAETDYARAKRARPRSSSATWSRDGLKQIEIDRYNERMGIQGPGVLLPLIVQDDGSGTPSRLHRLSAIAQSAINQGQISRKLSQSQAGRGTLSPTRPSSATSSIIRNGGTTSSQLLAGNTLAPSVIKYPSLQAGTPTRSNLNVTGNVTASSQKTKVVKPVASNASLQSTKSNTSSKTANSSKNVFQTGASQSSKASNSATTKKKL